MASVLVELRGAHASVLEDFTRLLFVRPHVHNIGCCRGGRRPTKHELAVGNGYFAEIMRIMGKVVSVHDGSCRVRDSWPSIGLLREWAIVIEGTCCTRFLVQGIFPRDGADVRRVPCCRRCRASVGWQNTGNVGSFDKVHLSLKLSCVRRRCCWMMVTTHSKSNCGLGESPRCKDKGTGTANNQ